MWQGYWLDDYTFICPAKDKDKTVLVKITTKTPRDKDGNIFIDKISGKYFDMEIIDPNNFEWNGYKLKIKGGIENV